MAIKATIYSKHNKRSGSRCETPCKCERLLQFSKCTETNLKSKTTFTFSAAIYLCM